MIEVESFPRPRCDNRQCMAKSAGIIGRGLGPIVKRGNRKYHIGCLPNVGLTKGDIIK
jgi:hypothetical protein